MSRYDFRGIEKGSDTLSLGFDFTLETSLLEKSAVSDRKFTSEIQEMGIDFCLDCVGVMSFYLNGQIDVYSISNARYNDKDKIRFSVYVTGDEAQFHIPIANLDNFSENEWDELKSLIIFYIEEKLWESGYEGSMIEIDYLTYDLAEILLKYIRIYTKM